MKIVPAIFLSIIFLIGAHATAAPQGPPPPGVPPPGLPIDGGVILLLVAALGYGLYKVNQRIQHKKNPV
ncbi:PID-CTERM protein-sorting domain-containing protein [Flavobacterium lotistagni]|uniref:PID-CTERM protein-sorting domain-containing protein n=1 Tax=Flavobacterium lotistagni TaxID=2709660 RepID=UPI003742368D